MASLTRSNELDEMLFNTSCRLGGVLFSGGNIPKGPPLLISLDAALERSHLVVSCYGILHVDSFNRVEPRIKTSNRKAVDSYSNTEMIVNISKLSLR